MKGRYINQFNLKKILKYMTGVEVIRLKIVKALSVHNNILLADELIWNLDLEGAFLLTVKLKNRNIRSILRKNRLEKAVVDLRSKTYDMNKTPKLKLGSIKWKN